MNALIVGLLLATWAVVWYQIGVFLTRRRCDAYMAAHLDALTEHVAELVGPGPAPQPNVPSDTARLSQIDNSEAVP